MRHVIHMIERRFGPRAPRIVAVLFAASAIGLAAGLVVFRVAGR